ncbi:DNA-directed RNA polymerase subunit beta' [Candidatus Vidania fulgoroideae]|uniref:DNA-directed RNA polymerase subunit n=1 Tax=Candidatus Vidania fulgoroideorum TaxID=881286 RepID=A0A974X7X3_9PROT|nr:DNA-directed RNA polymerase subunit beta' [Candidatus Vidania fulgoroideae]
MINFSSLKIRFLSDSDILSISNGEVKKSETINYRTLMPESNGLFCQKIFGPINNYQCLCNLGPRPEIKGSICSTCGVSILDSFSRRTRIGHISLNTPLLHIWMLRTTPSKISVILDRGYKYIEDIVYYKKFVVISSKSKTIKSGELISIDEYYNKILVYGSKLKVGIGASAIKDLLSNIDITKEISNIKLKLINSNKYDRDRLSLRYSIFKKFRNEGFNLSYLVVNNIPVLPADLRPLINLGGNRFISSDINELYKRLINRNNRLKKLININAPEFIIMNEKRLLQEAFDCLLDNGKRVKSYKTNNKVLLKSLSENIKGKYGRFRQNLLGKRVDYSGRAVIVVNPKLGLSYCNLPLQIALELFKPFIFRYLVKNNITSSFIESRSFLENVNNKYLFSILKKVTRYHPIILNRAPTLHRLNMQSFYPIITRDKSIKIHPLVCNAYNADFDGDQMSVHLPLSYESIKESKSLLLPVNNIFLPSNGLLSLVLSQEVILGLNYLTKMIPNNSNILYFHNYYDVISNYYLGNVNLNDEILFIYKENFIIRTTVGRMFIYSILPNKNLFLLINTTLDKNKVNSFINHISSNIRKNSVITKIISKIMKLGFHFSTKIGISISISDINTIPSIKSLLSKYSSSLLLKSDFVVTKGSSLKKFNDVSFYIKLSSLINRYSKMLNGYSITYFNGRYYRYNYRDNISNIIKSGSKGTFNQLFQISGVRGLVMKNSNELINFPIFSNLKKGMSSEEYYISTFGARKGLSDTSLKTSESGYLTRRLVDVSQNIIIKSHDCFTKRGIVVNYTDKYIYNYVGRFPLYDLFSNNGKIILNSNRVITPSDIRLVIMKKLCFLIRTPVFCLLKTGICSKCYGIDLSTKNIINEGNCIGVTSAQSIGEPGTQLTMRTFHTGGIISSFVIKNNISDYTKGFVKFTSNIHTINTNKLCLLNNSGCIISLDFNSNILVYKNIYSGNYMNFNNNRYYNTNKFNESCYDYKYCPFDSHYKLYNFSKCDGIIVYSCNSYKVFFIRKIDPRFKVFILLLGKKNKCILNIKESDFLILPKNHNVRQGFIIKFSQPHFQFNVDITNSLSEVSNFLEIRKCKFLSIVNKKTIFSNSHVTSSSKLILLYQKGIKHNHLYKEHITRFINKGSILGINKTNLCVYISLISILGVYGVNYLTKYFIYKLRSIYLTHGVDLNIKNFEVILKKILSFVLVIRSFNPIIKFKKVSRQNCNNNSFLYKTILTGITKVSLDSDSFISASSFQDTVKILVNSAFMFKIDRLKGMKENVIIGSIVPAGTGLFLRKL